MNERENLNKWILLRYLFVSKSEKFKVTLQITKITDNSNIIRTLDFIQNEKWIMGR